MNYISFSSLDKLDFIKAIFTNRNVDAKNIEDIKNICEDVGFNFNNLTFNKQVHGDNINIIDKEKIGKTFEGDGIITNLRNVPILVFVADCVPIAIIDTKNKAIGLVHAGWRSTFSQISKKAIDTMKQIYNSNTEDILCLIGPSIGPCCYEVNKELVDKFNNKFTNPDRKFYIIKEGKYFLDLWNINEYILSSCGIKKENIINTKMCTCCNNDMFYSYRKDNQTSKRMGFLLELI
ncbi:conserved hypothetical protein [Alkalithermobacter thermoalcaliphilus JW-YL-7 = DSM 7308]|uniref:Purine nucleoside phosphorylase n=1 Tax=Alkalithermobacter thermoalcaliphilus JW-YL-7 = DSM 7308 TaxID=1121328 RepID=A0A150FPL3_CLOPD|nr:Multi-copper polyphenol oxidoreductase, laccase [[Clostridium] paradoxum JW-YL-7 = DSM 7308]SHK97945.1 conserved hypothetical protein [[Clostridium] paradoxum JW-YL-7 = DSM 7308]